MVATFLREQKGYDETIYFWGAGGKSRPFSAEFVPIRWLIVPALSRRPAASALKRASFGDKFVAIDRMGPAYENHNRA
jgi:hypothetical protein